MIIDKTKQIDKLVKVKHQLYKEYYNKTSKKELIEFNTKLNDIETKIKKLNYSVINNLDITNQQPQQSVQPQQVVQPQVVQPTEKIEVKKLCQTYL